MDREAPRTIAKSARYPRVAVLLGVNQHYYIPLLICRSFSIIFTVIWAVQTCMQICTLLQANMAWKASVQEYKLSHEQTFRFRLEIFQIALAFVWAPTAAYLSHLFASSLMSRWLLHYSPAAVLVRLCSLSILLSYGCMQLFRITGTLQPSLKNLSRCLPIWVVISICLLVSYFTTQQDISIEQDRDDRKRRLVLRMKCLYTMAGSSLFSLLVLVLVIHIGSRNLREVWQDLIRAMEEQLDIDTIIKLSRRVVRREEL